MGWLRSSFRSPWLVASVALACGGDSSMQQPSTGDDDDGDDDVGTTDGGPGTTSAETSASDAGTTTDEADTTVGSPIVFDVGGLVDMGGVGEDVVCSSDLRYVLDGETGAIVEACGPGEGCAAGECVEACAAASAAQGSTGCEFVIPTSPFYANGQPTATQSGPCHALLVSNPWAKPAQLSFSRDGVDFDAGDFTRIPSGIGPDTDYGALPGTGIPSGQVAVVFLSHKPGVNNGGTSLECPIEPAVLEDTAAHGTTDGIAFELVSDTPIQVYDIIPYGGAASFLPSASLIFPSTAWGDSYLVTSPHQMTGSEWMLAVARQDNTTVTINSKVAITPGDIDDAPVNTATDYELDAGEFVQWQSVQDPVGSIIAADRPIGVFTGNTYLLVTTADNPLSGQDSAHQMIPDVNALGREYVGGGLYSRLPALAPESVLYRLVGVVDGTDLSWDPDPPIGAPDTLDAGQVVEFESRDLFSVRSQGDEYPFSLSQYMSGTLNGQPGCYGFVGNCDLGDDEWATLVPPDQFLQYYAFFVDPTYGTTTLVVTRRRGMLGFDEVEIECMGTIDEWMEVGDDGQFEVAHVELFRGGIAEIPECQTSQHVASSTGDFGVVVWGTDNFASYGYAAGGGLEAINGVVLDPQG